MDEQQLEPTQDDSKIQAGRGVPSNQDKPPESLVERRTGQAQDTTLADRVRKAGA